MLNGLARESETAAQRTFWRTRLEERVESAGPPPPVDADCELEELAYLLEGLATRHYSDGGATGGATPGST
jgi:hypothetical protein